jgi:anthranilate 1,2-dioxygenase small subunit
MAKITENGCRQIEDFLLDCAHGLDDDELETWPDFFTEDAVYQIIPRESYEQKLPLGILYCEGKGMMLDRINALRTANIFEPHTHCHILSRPRISARDDGGLQARTNFNVIRTKQDGAMEIYAAGKFVDEIVVEDGKPLFRDRRVVLESHRIDILLVVPL